MLNKLKLAKKVPISRASFLVIYIPISSLLSSCAFFNINQTHKKINVPNVRVPMVPGGTTNWHYIGKSATTNNFIINEIATNGIIKDSKDNIYTYQDRKSIFDTKTYLYPATVPHFKYILSSWSMNCLDSQYLLLTVKLYDDKANLLKSIDYTNNNDVRWLHIGASTFVEKHYKYICQQEYNNLSY